MALSVYLPGFWSIPPVDRDESRFAQASRQMFEAVALPVEKRDPAMHSGGLVIPMVQGKARLNKPPAIYWLQVASAGVFTGGDPLRDAIWMYRVPSLIAGLVTVLVTWRIGISMFDARAGWLGAALLAVAPVFVWEAHQARADQVMVAATVVGVWGLWKVATERRSDGATKGKQRQPSSNVVERQVRYGEGRWSGLGWAVLMWVAVGVGVMVKGPVTPMVVGLTAVGYGVASRDWRWMRGLRPMLGLAIVAAMVGPWVWAVAERQGGLGPYLEIVYKEVIGRSGEAQEGHWGPPGYHLLFMLVLFWPGCMMAGLGVWRAWGRIWRVRRDRGDRRPDRAGGRLPRDPRSGRPPLRLGFLLAWLVPSWLVFELVMTKLPHYTMPMYPALAMLSARAVFAGEASRLGGVGSRFIRLAVGIWSIGGAGVAGAAVGVFGVVVAAFLERSGVDGGTFGWPVLVCFWSAAALAAVVSFVLLMTWIRRGQFIRAQLYTVAMVPVLSVGVLQACMPQCLNLSPSIVRALEQVDPGGLRPIGLAGYHEDSMVFLMRGRVQRVNDDQVPTWISDHPDGLLVHVQPIHSPGNPWGLRSVKGTTGMNLTSGDISSQVSILESGHD